MPRVNRIAKCRKSPGECGKCGEVIPTGAPYLHWAFMVGGRGGPKIIRCGKPECRPRPWDLTRSEFLSAAYRIQDESFEGESADDLESQRDDIASQLRELASEQEDKFNNLPQGFHDADTGQLLQERAENCNQCADELEGVDCSVEEDCQDIPSRLQEIKEELASALDNLQL